MEEITIDIYANVPETIAATGDSSNIYLWAVIAAAAALAIGLIMRSRRKGK